MAVKGERQRKQKYSLWQKVYEDARGGQHGSHVRWAGLDINNLRR